MKARYAAGLCAATLLAVASIVCAGNARASSDFPGLIQFGWDQPDPWMWAAPEGIAVDKTGNVFVSVLAPSPGIVPWAEPWNTQIWKFSPSGQKSVLADFYEYDKPAYLGGNCGLAVDAEGNVYMARFLAPPLSGVFRVDKQGGLPVLLPGTNQIQYPDGLAFDERGNLYVTEFYTEVPGGFGQGGIWRIPKGGTAELWLRDDLLTGQGNPMYPFPCGANGIRFYQNAVYVSNSDKMTVVRVPVLPDGSPGAPELWAQIGDVPESPFFGMPYPLLTDGLEMDALGNVYVPVCTRCAVVRINATDRTQETVAYFPRDPLDAPLSFAFGTGKGDRQSIFVTNSGGFWNVFGSPFAGNSIAKVDAGIPGLPLP